MLKKILKQKFNESENEYLNILKNNIGEDVYKYLVTETEYVNDCDGFIEGVVFNTTVGYDVFDTDITKKIKEKGYTIIDIFDKPDFKNLWSYANLGKQVFEISQKLSKKHNTLTYFIGKNLTYSCSFNSYSKKYKKNCKKIQNELKEFKNVKNVICSDYFILIILNDYTNELINEIEKIAEKLLGEKNIIFERPFTSYKYDDFLEYNNIKVSSNDTIFELKIVKD